MADITISQRFQDVAMCPSYPILGFRFMATANDSGELSVDDWNEQWNHGGNKMASAISDYANSRIDDSGNLIVTLQNKNNTISLGGSDILFIYKDLVTDEFDIMGMIKRPINNPEPTQWMVATSTDDYGYVNYIFNFGKIFDGIKCDLMLECKDESIGHVLGSDVDKHILNYNTSNLNLFVMKNSADYVIKSNKSSRTRLKNSFMINPSGLMNYGYDGEIIKELAS